MSVTREGEVLFRAIQRADQYIREILQDYRGGLGGGGIGAFRELRTVFENVVNSTIRIFDSGKAQLDQWKSAVGSGDKEYDLDTETAFKDVLDAWVALAAYLYEEASAEFNAGRSVVHPRRLGLLRIRLEAARRMVSGWVTPAAQVEEGVGEMKDLLGAMARGEPLSRSEELRALADEAARKGDADLADSEAWATRLASDFARADD